MGKMVRLLAVLCLLAFSVGCATNQPPAAPPPPPPAEQYHEQKALDDHRAAAMDQADRAIRWERIIDAAVKDSIGDCTDYLELKGDRSDSRRVWPAALMITGIVAGSVVVPALAAGNAAANAGWIAGVGGLSGGAIASSKVLESSGLSGSADAKDRNKVAAAVRELAAVALDPSKPVDTRMAAAVRIKVECKLPDMHVPTIPGT